MHGFVSFECVAHNFMCVQTFRAHKLSTFRAHKSSTIKAVMDIGAGPLTVATSDVCSIATLSNGKDIQQTVVKKNWLAKLRSDFLVARGLLPDTRASEFPMPLAHFCVFFQTLTAKCVKTRDNFRYFVGLETN